MKNASASEIRKLFTQFFHKHGHQVHPSSALVPHNDPTLLFTSAGMVQFKEFFTGQAQPKHSRLVTVQKCVRAGGKHNDLENVGFTARHHTFFEMLGNFSFGDYFKREAIHYAWEFLTKTIEIPKERLYVTVHKSDQEAADLWHKGQGVPRERIFFRGDKDNFWEMGETGPCGPSSEIFYDHGPEHSNPHADTSQCLLDDEERYVEIWNLVFMQYERYREGGEIKQRPLPNPCVDTGSGLERIAAALQGKYNNFDTDCFTPIIKEIERLSQRKVSDAKYAAWIRVVADHVRSGVMLLSDGVLPSNEGRGYVLRRILRRAIRHLDLLGVEDVTLYKLVGPVLEVLGDFYPELERNREFVTKYLKLEEESFRQTLTSGLRLLEEEIATLKKSGSDTLKGDHIFKLYDTHGFPVDLTEMILREQGLKADHQGFEKHMASQRERSKKASDFSSDSASLTNFYKLRDQHGPTKFLGYEKTSAQARLIGIEPMGKRTALVFEQTPFYAESGGQVGDAGVVAISSQEQIKIIDTQKPIDDLFAHLIDGPAPQSLTLGSSYELRVNESRRRNTMAHHTATHLLHSALQKVLGDHVKQAGSYVGPDRLRFDFTHPESVSPADLKKIEALVNEQISAAVPVGAQVMSKADAEKRGAMALFGEKYGDQVRVIDVGNFSLELCGGTHVTNTSQIRFFKVISEGALASGVRRLEAVAGESAAHYISESFHLLQNLEQMLSVKGEALVTRVSQLLHENNARSKELLEIKLKLQATKAEKLFDQVSSTKSGDTFIHIKAEEDMDLRSLGDQFLSKYPKGVALITAPKGDKASVLLKTYRGNPSLNCSDLLKETLKPLGGSGGGKPDMAQGSVDRGHIPALIEKITSTL